MADRAPYRGRLPVVSRTTSGDSPEVSRANMNQTLGDIEREFARGKEHSDVDARGNSVRGDGNDRTVTAKFKKANIPLFISHDLGYTVRNWTIVDKCGPGDVYRPGGKKYAPNKNGIWLACDTPACEVRIRLDGQEANK